MHIVGTPRDVVIGLRQFRCGHTVSRQSLYNCACAPILCRMAGTQHRMRRPDGLWFRNMKQGLPYYAAALRSVIVEFHLAASSSS